jgi:hypothetical protein
VDGLICWKGELKFLGLGEERKGENGERYRLSGSIFLMSVLKLLR